MPSPGAAEGNVFGVLAAEWAGRDGVTLGTMFGAPGLRVRGKVFAFRGGDGRLIVKLPPARVAQVEESGSGRRVAMGGRVMREWIECPLGDGEHGSSAGMSRWRELAQESHDDVCSLVT